LGILTSKKEQIVISLDLIADKANPNIAKSTSLYSEFRILYNDALVNLKDFELDTDKSSFDELVSNLPKLKSRPWSIFFDTKEYLQIVTWLTFVCIAWTILFIMGKDHPHIISAGFVVLITNTVLVQTKMLNKRKKIKLKKKLKRIDTASKELIQFLKVLDN
jgi:hypothetical protein